MLISFRPRLTSDIYRMKKESYSKCGELLHVGLHIQLEIMSIKNIMAANLLNVCRHNVKIHSGTRLDCRTKLAGRAQVSTTGHTWNNCMSKKLQDYRFLEKENDQTTIGH